MKHWFLISKRWSLAIASAATLTIGSMALLSCGGEGGPIGGGGGGTGNSFTAQFMALLPAGQAGATYVGPDTCGDCHNGQTANVAQGGGGEEIYNEWHETVHFTKNVTCENCHGPGSKHAANPSTDNILTAPKSNNAVVCGQCHGPIYDQWYSSKHRQLITAPVEEAATNPAQYGRSSRCIQCHSGLFRTETAEKGVDVGTMTDQQIFDLAEEAINDVPNTANCATCHNPHANTGNLNDNGEEVQLRHKVFNVDTTPVGPSTTAASFVNFDQICAQCHNGRGTDPSDAKLNSGTSRPSMHDSNQYQMLMGFGGVEGGGPVERNTAHAQAPGQCSTCHMPASKHTFVTNYDTSCSPCHTAADAAARTTSVRSEVFNNLYNLLLRLQNWANTTYGNSLFWEYTSNITAEGFTPPNQSGVPIEIKRARHNYYFVIRDACFGPHNAPYALHLIRVANDNLDSLNVPQAPAGRGISQAQQLEVFKTQLSKWQQLEHEAGD